MQKAIQTIACIADGVNPELDDREHESSSVPSQDLANQLQTFETMLELSAQSEPQMETPKSLQVGFDIIMAAAANLASSDSTRLDFK